MTGRARSWHSNSLSSSEKHHFIQSLLTRSFLQYWFLHAYRLSLSISFLMFFFCSEIMSPIVQQMELKPVAVETLDKDVKIIQTDNGEAFFLSDDNVSLQAFLVNLSVLIQDLEFQVWNHNSILFQERSSTTHVIASMWSGSELIFFSKLFCVIQQFN